MTDIKHVSEPLESTMEELKRKNILDIKIHLFLELHAPPSGDSGRPGR